MPKHNRRQSRQSNRSGRRDHSSGHHNQRRAPDRLYNIVPVRLRTNRVRHDFDAQELHLRVGEHVIIETQRGPTIGRVDGHIQRRLLPSGSVNRVLRKANEQDLDQDERNQGLEESAYRFALDRIRARKLPMKLIRTQYMHDGSKIVFFFSADGRIDFRDLVKDLAHKFRTRIEMHQIGVRDGARMLGGIGPCGRELCCSTFLDNFAPVSIRMAKEQGLTLNPKKVSGMCGRLMCCLVYEQQLYKSQRRKLPRPGTQVYTEAGPGRVLNVDIINKRLVIELEDTNIKTFPAKEVALQPVEELPEEELGPPSIEPDYLWDDLLAGLEDEDGELSSALLSDAEEPHSDNQQPKTERKNKRKRSPNRRRGRGSRSTEKSQEPAGEEATSQEPKPGEKSDQGNKRRRSRRRRSRKQGDKPQGSGAENKPSESRQPRGNRDQNKQGDGEKKQAANKRSRRRRRRGGGGKQGDAGSRGDSNKGDSHKDSKS